MNKIDYMEIALNEAKKAFDMDEIPIGALIVKNGTIIAKSHNNNRKRFNPIRHAEINVIEEAAEKLKNERLIDCELYVTKEPCVMCAGAIVHARIKKVYIGARDNRYGACGTVFSICGNNRLNHVPEIEFDILQNSCSLLLKEFFKMKRKS